MTAIASLLALPAAAQALPEGYHYEMVSPPDKNDGDIGAGNFRGQYFASPDGNHLAYSALGGFGNAESNGISGAYAATRGEDLWESTSLLLQMAPSSNLSSTSVPAISSDFSKALSQTSLNQETGEAVAGLGAPFGYLMDVPTRDIELFTVATQSGSETYAIGAGDIAGNSDWSRIVYTAGADLFGDGLAPTARRLYVYEETDSGPERRALNFLPNGDAVAINIADTYRRGVSAEADVAYFTTTASGAAGLYRRDIDGETTDRVNVDENPDEDLPLGTANFVGASADGEVAYFTSSQALLPEDDDNLMDLYRYDQSQPEGSRLTLISVDNEPDDTHRPVRVGLAVSADGETVMFSSDGQLVDGEPLDGTHLYAYTDGEIRYVSPTNLVNASALRSLKLSEDGETFAFVTNMAGITPDPNGGQQQVYVYDVAGDTPPVCVSCRPDGEPNTVPAMFAESVNLTNFAPSNVPRRAVSDEGHVIFQTTERLVTQDTNGKMDVYVWQDGELDILSTGRSSDHSFFLDASVDGSTVFIGTREQLSGWDWDNRVDAYAVRTGDGLPEPEPVEPPCTGADCHHGPPSAPPEMPEPGTGSYEGPGNPEFADCSALEADAEAAQQKAKKLKKKAKKAKRKAKKASGKKAKKLKKKAKKANKKAKKANKQAKQARQQLDNCRSNG